MHEVDRRLERITTLVQSGDKELIALGLIVMGKEFTKQEIIEGLVPIENLHPFAGVQQNTVFCPFGIVGSGSFALRIHFGEFVLHMGYGPHIIYCDEQYDATNYDGKDPFTPLDKGTLIKLHEK